MLERSSLKSETDQGTKFTHFYRDGNKLRRLSNRLENIAGNVVEIILEESISEGSKYSWPTVFVSFFGIMPYVGCVKNRF